MALEEDTSFASRRVTRVLEAVIAGRGVPQAIRCDDGPELTSRHFLAWCIERKLARELVREFISGERSLHGEPNTPERAHSSLGYWAPPEFAREIGCGKDGGFATLENASRFPLFPASAATPSSPSRTPPAIRMSLYDPVRKLGQVNLTRGPIQWNWWHRRRLNRAVEHRNSRSFLILLLAIKKDLGAT